MINIVNLKIDYNKKNIIENFNLSIKKGEKVVITGVSGSGKSSILKAILGFIIPSSGDILINGERLTAKTVNSFRRNMCYVSQGIDFPNEKISVLIEEIFNYKNNKKYKKNIEKLEHYLKLFNLDSSILEKNIDELSGGEKQRIGIVIALLLDREIFILDEITSALDSEMKKKTVNYFLNADKTVIAVSHDSEWIELGIAREVRI